MVDSGCEDLAQAKGMAVAIKREINKMFKLLELDIDGIYRPLLLLQKKKYAAVAVEERDGKIHRHIEKKGLDLVRRDWCVLSRELGEDILASLLSQGSKEDIVDQVHTKLRVVGERVRNGQVNLNQFVINRSINRKPEEYHDAKCACLRRRN